MAFVEAELSIGYTKELAYSDTESGTFVAIPGTVEVNLPERELGNEETTNDDTPDAHKDYLPTLFDPGTASFTYRYGKTAFAAFEAIFQSKATKWFKLTYPDGSSAKWRAFITKHHLPADIEGVLTVEGEMQARGKVTFTAASV